MKLTYLIEMLYAMIHRIPGRQTVRFQNNYSLEKMGGGGVFEKEFSQFRVIRKTRNECFLFLLSGGVIAKTFYLPLKDKAVNMIKRIDTFLVKKFPSVFACGCSVVLQKKEGF